MRGATRGAPLPHRRLWKPVTRSSTSLKVRTMRFVQKCASIDGAVPAGRSPALHTARAPMSVRAS